MIRPIRAGHRFGALLAAFCLAVLPLAARVPPTRSEGPAGGARASFLPAGPPPAARMRTVEGRSGYQPMSLGSRRSLGRLAYYPGSRTLVPPAWDRWTSLPDAAAWGRRDILAQIQWLSRKGFLPVTPLGPGVTSLSDYAFRPAGWRAYGIAVPAGGKIQVEVSHPKLGWFRLMAVDQWGEPGPGMYQAAIAHQPVMVTLTNPFKEARAIYVIVDDPGWWSDAEDPYVLTVHRDWDPAKVDVSQVKMVAGLWGASPSVSAEFSHPSLTGPAVFPY